MADTSKRLEEEARKWLTRLEAEVKGMQKLAELEGLDNSIENIHSYIEDCKHFLEKGDFVNAFEAAIYSWGIFETLLSMHLIKVREK